MCALYVLQKECRKVWGARYTLGAHYRSENTVLEVNCILLTVRILEQQYLKTNPIKF